MNHQTQSGGPPFAGTTFILPYVTGKVKRPLKIVDSEQRSQVDGNGDTGIKENPDDGMTNITVRLLAIPLSASSEKPNATVDVAWRENKRGRRRMIEGYSGKHDTRRKAKNVWRGLDHKPLQANSVWLYIDHFQGSPSLQCHAMRVWFKGHMQATISRNLGAHAAQTYRRTFYMEPLPGRVHNHAWRISISRNLADFVLMWGKRIKACCFRGVRLSKQFPSDEPWGALPLGNITEETTTQSFA
ncbi:hypothetical protein ACRALDRAFT_1073534 [Sodiomyces alcalophilus JCM 7366]|uniref:uncharacterized protein n=1 Tax=Sodiomyces alcalophilus JCM 7366 TaxID=591952 RepID=UPI0039B4A965